MSKKELVILILVALLIVVGLFVLAPALFGGSAGASETPGGSIVISSVTANNLPFLDTYVLNVGTGNLIMDEPDTSSQENMYSFSSNGTSVAFLGAPQTLVQKMVTQEAKGDPMQVYLGTFDPTAGTLPSVSQARGLTNDTADQKEVPVVSADGNSVLYMEIPASEAASSSPSIAGYTIHLVSDATSSTLSVAGMYPQWFGQNTFYYLGSDGVRLYNITSATSTLVIPIQAQSDFKLAVSQDDSMLAFSDPDSSTIFMYSISDNGFQLTPLKSISATGYWVVFSPDNAYIAVQSADNSGTPEMLIFDTKTFSQVGQPISLSPLLNDRLFVTAWTH